MYMYFSIIGRQIVCYLSLISLVTVQNVLMAGNVNDVFLCYICRHHITELTEY